MPGYMQDIGGLLRSAVPSDAASNVGIGGLPIPHGEPGRQEAGGHGGGGGKPPAWLQKNFPSASKSPAGHSQCICAALKTRCQEGLEDTPGLAVTASCFQRRDPFGFFKNVLRGAH
jgi:hypothetical protein